MAKGTIASPLITWEEILNVTNNGYDIFVNEIGAIPVSKTFKHPLYNDRQPSAALICLEGMWFLKDFSGDMPTMTALQFTMRKYGLSYKEAIEKMAMDFGLMKRNGIYNSVPITWKPPIIEREECQISFSTKKWKKEQYLFWENTLVDERHCLKYETYAVKDAAIHRKRVNIRENEVVWAYYVPELDKVKLYFPERKKEDRFRGSLDNTYIWNIQNITECDKLLLQKSMKDLLVTTIFTPCVIATQNESAITLLENNYEQIDKLANKKIVCFGSDFQGWHESLLITYYTEWGYCNTPNQFLPEINDYYGLSRKYGAGELEKLLKSKGII